MSVTAPRSSKPLTWETNSQSSTPAPISTSTPSSISRSAASTPRPYNEYTLDRFDSYDHGIWDSSDTPPAGYTMGSTSNLLVCFTCGTQFDIEDPSILKTCRICDDPRQFVPPTGQSFTTLSELKDSKKFHNECKVIDNDDRFWSIKTEPQIAIGQRAILIKTEVGNVLWDCITYLDQDTTDWINSLGGLAAIVISHPHYYSTHLEWAEEFDCPVYLSWEDKEWLNRLDRLGKARCFIEGTSEELEINGEKSGVTAIKLGGHFPGSLVLLAFGRLMIADTIVTTPSGRGNWSSGPAGPQAERPEGLNSYSFLWSIPNMIPLSAEEVQGMWNILNKYEFSSTHGAFLGMDINDGFGGSKKGVKQRILDSMQIQVHRMGWKDHEFLKEVVK